MNETEQRPLRVLLIYRKLIPSIRLCGHCQLERLAEQGKLEYKAVPVMKLTDADLNWADAAVLGRLDNAYERKLAAHLKKAGKYLIYILDDDLLNIPPHLSSAAYYLLPETRASILGMLQLSDAILSPSPLLLEKYAVDGRRSMQIEEPTIAPAPYRPHDPGAPVKIGFAGSIDRTQDLEDLLKEALLRIQREYGDGVEFQFFGAIPGFARDLGAKCLPYCDSYEDYRRTLDAAAWDIGLAPMPDTPFHSCKHYNKFCEYAAASIAGVFSAVPPYTRAMHMDDAGTFCPNTSEDWYLAVKSLLDDPGAREARRERMSHYAHTTLSLETSAQTLYEMLQPVPRADPKKRLRLVIARYKPRYYLSRVVYVLKTYKLGVFKKAFQKLFRMLKRG